MNKVRRPFSYNTYLFLVLLLVFSRAFSQQVPEHLTTNQAIAVAMANNRELRLAVLDEKIAAARYKETEAVFLPQAGISYTAITTNNPLNAFGFKLQQQSISSADFNPDLLNHPNGTADFMARLDVQQPLVNIDQYYMRKGAARQLEAYQYKNQRTKEWLVFEVQKAYMQLQLAYGTVKVWEDALQTANALYRFTNDRVEQGLLSKPDALNIKVLVAGTESNFAEARSNVQNASDYLGLLMGKPLGIIYAVASDSTADRELPVADTVLPAGRADFAALQKGIEASDLAIRSRKFSALPRLNAFGAYQLNDSRALVFGANAWLAGIQLSWDLFKGNSIRNKTTTQLLERDKLANELSLLRQQSHLELDKTNRQLADAGYKIQQQKAAITSAAESLRILEDRYEQGLTNSTDVLTAQNQLAQQRLGLEQAVFQQQVTIAWIHYLTTSSEK